MRLAPKMGLADSITADATFDQLACNDDGPEDERFISADVLARYNYSDLALLNFVV